MQITGERPDSCITGVILMVYTVVVWFAVVVTFMICLCHGRRSDWYITSYMQRYAKNLGKQVPPIIYFNVGTPDTSPMPTPPTTPPTSPRSFSPTPSCFNQPPLNSF